MGAMPNPKHEAFAQLRFKGKTVDDAYVGAGYRPNGGNAGRLNTNDGIRARVAELQEAAARAAIQAIAYDAKSLFARLENQIALALADANHKVAGDLRMFMIECFGYHDSPTLTHDHIANRRLEAPAPPPQEGDGNVTFLPPPQERRFAQVMMKLRRKLNEG